LTFILKCIQKGGRGVQKGMIFDHGMPGSCEKSGNGTVRIAEKNKSLPPQKGGEDVCFACTGKENAVIDKLWNVAGPSVNPIAGL
jgi:hypothetical protein